ncbi:hypothetical protein [Qaidamihabitans albus]|uniref:hypothetical protein n=1 Tax=Qaidamihabitans albus TaxID=2795733 RepID=UPI0027DB5D1F|nr:hypothetical protein [Qaidamihabitans albus]
MRIRVVLATLAGALLLMLPACSEEAGPTPKQAPDPGPEALSVKLGNLMVDPCFRRPAEMDPPSCQKYVTQLASVPGTAEKFAGTEHPELAAAARELAAGVSTYRDNGCAAPDAGEACTRALTDIAAAVEEIEAGVGELPGVPETAG